ncbi:MAG: ribonuclease P protein component [Patescibacteria group bacterium]|nr:ribonuclease P protein component [Patescibacteria group bacterium]
MLCKANRLVKKNDFAKVLKSGRSAASEFLVLKCLKNDLSNARAGFVVSRKISNKAVVRNLVKRRLREAMRANLERTRPGWDLVFLTRPGIEKKKFAEMKTALESLLRRASLLAC